MLEPSFPWLELCVLLPSAGAVWARFASGPGDARRRALVASGLALSCAVAAWLSFQWTDPSQAGDRWPSARLIDRGPFTIDELSAPLMPLSALVFFLTNLATLRTKVREFSFERALGSEAIFLATLGCRAPWAVVALLTLGTLPPYLELRKARKPARAYAVHMLLFIALLGLGQMLLDLSGGHSRASWLGALLLAAAVLLRSGAVPAHCWMTELFEYATFGTALLFVVPMAGAYGAMRLVLPVAPRGVLQAVSLVSLFTAAYAACMALVQVEARRFFCFLFLSNSSLVLVGVVAASPIGLTGALSLWISVALSLTGFGLALRCVESRVGRITLSEFHGLYRHVSRLATFFLLTGLASIGFPGTAGFVSLELLVEGVVRAWPLMGASVVAVAALNGLAVMRAYFRIFTGKPRVTSIDLDIRVAERVSILIISVLILGVGLCPQPSIVRLHHAATELVQERNRRGLDGPRPTKRTRAATSKKRAGWPGPAHRPGASLLNHAAEAPYPSPPERHQRHRNAR